jgi:WD40 repeat protein
VTTGQNVTTLATRPTKVRALLFVDNRRLAAGGTDNRISIWDVDSRQVTGRLIGHTGTVASLACDRTGTVLVSGSYDAKLRIWNVADTEVPTTASREPVGASR